MLATRFQALVISLVLKVISCRSGISHAIHDLHGHLRDLAIGINVVIDGSGIASVGNRFYQVVVAVYVIAPLSE